MIEIAQEEVPYLVLTWDPNLQAYRTDTIAGVERGVSRRDGRSHLRADLV